MQDELGQRCRRRRFSGSRTAPTRAAVLQTTESDDDGGFRFDSLGGPAQRVQVSANRYVAVSADVCGEAQPVVLEIYAEDEVEVTVDDGEGAGSSHSRWR